MSRLFCLLLLLFVATRADAKAAFQSPEKMIATSEAIAIVQIEKVETVAVKGANWTYRQRATARVERVIKGPLRTELALHGDEDFICARCHFVPGRALVFLKRDGNLWTGNNWQFGARPIENERVEWFGKGVFDLKPQPLDEVLKQVQMIVETQAKAPKFMLWFRKPDVPLWSVDDFQTKTSRVFERDELEAWIKTLPLGSTIVLALWLTSLDPDAATRNELKAICYSAGVQWESTVWPPD